MPFGFGSSHPTLDILCLSAFGLSPGKLDVETLDVLRLSWRLEAYNLPCHRLPYAAVSALKRQDL